MSDLSGQVALVTGGGRGLGRAMAIALANAGAAVAVCARSESELAETVTLIKQTNSRSMHVVADVTDHEVVARMVEQVEQTLGPIDLLVNNAGVMGVPSPIWDADPLDWKRSIDVNLNAVYYCSQSVLKGMVKRQRGRIINVSSVGGTFVAPNLAHYLTSKAALLRLTECMAIEASPYGIVVFAIHPGTVLTAMMDYLTESDAALTHVPWIRESVHAGNHVPIELCMQLVTLLASGKADELNGRFIQVSDDIEAMIAQAERIKQEDLYTLRLNKLL